MSELQRLIEAVEAGTIRVSDLDPFVMCFGMNTTANDAHMAYRGDLNAAKMLHEAMLPGWAVDDLSQNGRLAGHPWGIRIAFWNATNPDENKQASAGWGCDTIPDRNPARAWLLAILRALAAMEQ